MIRSLGDLVERNARFFPDDEFIVWEGQRLTNRAFFARARRLGSALMKAGSLRQDRVAILAMNGAAYLEAMAACWLTGLIVSTINFRLAPPEISYILGDTEPRVLLFEAQYAECIDSIRHDLSIETYVCVGDNAPDWAFGYEAFLLGGDQTLPKARVEPHEIATILYTSGTTGRPKGVMRSHRAELALGDQMAMMFDVRTGGRMLIVMPYFHAGAQSSTYAQLWRSGTLFIHRVFDPAEVLRTVAAERITHLHFVPQMLQAVVDAAEDIEVDTSSVETIAYAAAPMSPALLRRALARFGPVFVNGWGMTEGNGTSLPKHRHSLDRPELLASIGQPPAPADIRIVDDEGRDCGPGETGELWLQSASVMTGYWNNSTATIEALRDGWLRTGDLGYADETGNIFLVDRKKDMIISGGENIYSQEVERAIAEHPDVADVAVIGVPDDKWGEAVMAVIVPRAGAIPDADAIIAHSASLIARYKKPRHIRFVDALPLLSSGKIDKIALRAQFGQTTPSGKKPA